VSITEQSEYIAPPLSFLFSSLVSKICFVKQMPDRKPQPGGVLDPRLGISNKRTTCETCGQALTECTGHFGYIALELPVFHIGYFRNTQQILQCICKSCARVLLNDEDRRVFARRFRSSSLERTRREAVFRRVLDRCKRVKFCPHCGEFNGPVKKAPSSLKLVHDQFAKPNSPDAKEKYIFSELTKAADNNESIRQNVGKIMDDLNPSRVQGLFRAIPDEDCELLDLAGRPEHLLMTHVPVPPVCIRPSVEMDGGAGSNEDDLTVKLMQIVEVNNILRQGMEKGLPVPTLTENWDFLQVQCAVYINSDLPGVTSMYQVPGKPTRGFVQRLKGKQGRCRGNLSGKRVDFSGRTVISPNPTLGVEEVGVPRLMAITLTFPERVTDSNMDKLRKRVLAGAGVHPGANFVVFPSGDKTFLKYGDRRRIAAELKVGDVVERHLEDGDVVLFNRQPSLHRMSIMSHRVRVLEGRTLRFNECVCAPYNADFDGDEMNVHVPQTEEARAEARELLGVRHNLATPKSGEILIAATQDFLTASFLLTSKDSFFTRAQVWYLHACTFSHVCESISCCCCASNADTVASMVVQGWSVLESASSALASASFFSFFLFFFFFQAYNQSIIAAVDVSNGVLLPSPRRERSFHVFEAS
jgi:DNA-directed RNA polymerase III subunit RPC1